MFNFLKKPKPIQAQKPPTLESRKAGVSSRRVIAAKYDAAQTTVRNQRHWSMSSADSPNSENSLAVRKLIRQRSRYEAANNTYCGGMIKTHAEWLIGTGPILQIKSPLTELNQSIEELWVEWSRYIQLPKKLRLMRQAKMRDGEAFAMLINNPLSQLSIQLDLRLLECDRFTNQFSNLKNDANNIDGVIIDDNGNITHYEITEQHPGDNECFSFGKFQTRRVSAKYIVALMNQTRPEQVRMSPETASALELFGISRDYTLATLRAAQTASEIASVIQTPEIPAGGEEPEERPEMMDTFELERGMATVLPEGYEISQIKPEHPTSTFAEFDKRLLNGQARGLGQPMNVATGNSEGYNYASGRLDHQSFIRTMDVEQNDLGSDQLDHIFIAWWSELLLIPQFADFAEVLQKNTLRSTPIPQHEWMFPGLPHIDPNKEATAFDKLLKADGITLEQWYAKQGLDWRTQLKQTAEENKVKKELGITNEDIKEVSNVK